MSRRLVSVANIAILLLVEGLMECSCLHLIFKPYYAGTIFDVDFNF